MRFSTLAFECTLNIKIYHEGFRGPTLRRIKKDPMGRAIARYLLL